VRVLSLLLSGTVILLLMACSGQDAKVRKAAVKPESSRTAELMPPEAVGEPEEEYRYDPQGKPDPFRSFVRVSLTDDPDSISSPLERFDLSQLSVTGIIWAAEEARALVKDPAGKGYIVAVGTSIGKNKGKVVRIEDNRVLVKETYVDFRDRATTKEVELHLYETQGG
jgi:type IV pilus assembly protein PilP